ncbi:hypothetical protein RchiOBHm_Chr5g0069881 [Rosa chinensis]|uniref:Uncharacterized protein n=1 Tax=Rosa chinensis TaxID=74649 RepID=A0A2P6QK24_ROSCH|nr:hypothetical protein RchiOBHm_Chr5g0069881 [Rosa chinensis]
MPLSYLSLPIPKLTPDQSLSYLSLPIPKLTPDQPESRRQQPPASPPLA